MLDSSINNKVHEAVRKLLANRAWLSRNLKEIQADYAEKWIAIADEKIVASGATFDEVEKQVADKYPREEILILRIPAGDISRPI